MWLNVGRTRQLLAAFPIIILKTRSKRLIGHIEKSTPRPYVNQAIIGSNNAEIRRDLTVIGVWSRYRISTTSLERFTIHRKTIHGLIWTSLLCRITVQSRWNAITVVESFEFRTSKISVKRFRRYSSRLYVNQALLQRIIASSRNNSTAPSESSQLSISEIQVCV